MCVMAYRQLRLGALAIADPDQARAEIALALDAAQGNAVHAAGALGVSHRNLCRLLVKLGLREPGPAPGQPRRRG